MIRKIAFAALMVLLLLPTLAGAATKMQVTSSALPATGGSISPNGIQFFTGAASYTINVNSGWSISSVLIDNVNSPNGTALSQTVPFDTSKVHTLKVTFTQSSSLYSITTSAGAGGQIQITGGGLTNIVSGSNRTVIVSPLTGYKIQSYIVDGGSPVVPANPNVAASIPFTNITGNHIVSATFSAIIVPITVSAGNNQTIDTNSTTLNGSVSVTPATFLWNLVSGPAGSAFGTATAASTTFTGLVVGTYTVTLTANGVTSDPVTISVTSNGILNCIQCHSGSVPVNDWQNSKHAATPGGATCGGCHMPGNEPHPGQPTADIANTCLVCHTANPANHPNVTIANSDTCVSCHNPHSLIATKGAPHFNNITGNLYPASYMTSKALCSNCHVSSDSNQTIRQQWAKSGHADTTALPWIDYDFKTRAGCGQCHTTTGFIAYSTAKVTAAWGVASDKTKEVLTCIGCHSDVAAGTVRTIFPNRPYVDETSYINRNVGTSNICMDCHSGVNNGTSIQVMVGRANFNTAAFIAPHYLTAGGTLHGKNGYQFPGQTYAGYSSNSHRKIGMSNTAATGPDGPCVTCHMTATAKHSLTPVSTDQNGVITAFTTTVCTNCHSAALPAATLDADRVAFTNGLDILKAQLTAINHAPLASYPYFTSGGWGTDQAGANVMGAAFNYKTFTAEPGAYAHNPAYAKQLIIDSIDSAYNGGTVSGRIDTVLAAMVAANTITQDQANRLNAYKAASNCASCHTNTSGKHTIHVVTNSIGCAECHSQTAASNTALVSGSQKHLNGTHDVDFSYAANTCSAVYCHSNGAGTYANPNWVTGASNCLYCHPLNSLRGAHAAHIGANPQVIYGDTANHSTDGEYSFGCGSCHPTSAISHRDNHIDVTLAPADAPIGTIRSKNDPAALIGGVGNTGSGITGISGTNIVCSAAYCHSNGEVGAALIYVSSPNWYGTFTGDKCAMCHGNAPATGAHTKHGVSIHSGNVIDADGSLIATAAAAGQVAGHGDPAQSTTIGCITCHSITVTSSGNDKNSACASCHIAPITKGAPTLNKINHLNGSVDVAFKDVKVVTKSQIRPSNFGKYSTVWTRTGSSYKVDAGSYDTAKLSLNQATFGGDKSCANVACHNGGTPKWSEHLTCVSCHSAL